MYKENLLIELEKRMASVIKDLGYDLYHIEYVVEGGENFLRFYIENEAGIGLNDCEKVSRAVSDIIDVEDPIDENYYLEVSSPGVFRTLFKEEHFKRYIGEDVTVRLNSLLNGKKKFDAILENIDDENIYVKTEKEVITVSKKILKQVTLNGEI